jgi:hypothetical protein
MAQQAFEDIAAAVMQAESRGKRYRDDGKTLTTSPKGALGEMQVMPKTILDPGFGVAPAKDKSPDEIARVGQDYLRAMLNRYGDTEKALVAYNWGPGSTDKWIAAGANPKKLPPETRTYVDRIKGFLDNASTSAPNVSRETQTPAEQTMEPALRSGMTAQAPIPAQTPAQSQSAASDRLAALGPSYQAALALSFLADTDEKEDRDVEREPGVAEKYLAEMDAVPKSSGLAQFADVKIRSPFAEPPQPQMLAEGGEVGDASETNEELEAASKPSIKEQFLKAYRKAAIGVVGPVGGPILDLGYRAYKHLTNTQPLEDFLKQAEDANRGKTTKDIIRGTETGSMTPVKRYQGSPETGEQAPTAAELEAASRPATVNPMIQRKGEAARRLAAMRDVNTLPDPRTYSAVSGFLGTRPDEQGFSVMHPDREGIRQAGEAGFYAGTALQVAPVVGMAGKATGKAAKMLEDVTVGNIQRGQVRRAGAQAENIPDTAYDPLRQRMEDSGNLAYAVRNKGTPFMMGFERGPDGNYKIPAVDQAQRYIKQEVAVTGDPKLNDWLSNKLTSYLRRDFATPDDQFVKAADNNQLLHFVNKPIKRTDLDPYYNRIDSFGSIENLPYVRKTQGFKAEGEAKTAYGERAETLTDASAWPLQLDDIAADAPGLIPPGMRNMVKTDPTARLTEIGTNIDEMLQFDKLADDMERMRSMPKIYSAYSQPGIKVPEEYLLTDKMLIGLTPAQASNRVAKFRNWEEESRQRMASQFMKEDPRLSREELPGKFTAVALPDLQKSPEIRRLAMDVGCDGNWCTKEQSSALGYGSGDSRLHIVLDEKARPMAQITFTKLPPTKRQLEADPSADDRFSITELLGKDNSKDFSKNPALPAIQQYIKALDRRYDLRYITNLDEIGMKELSIEDAMKGARELSDRRQRYKPGIDPQEYLAAKDRDYDEFKTAVQGINGGSKYFTKDQNVDSLIQQVLERLAPQQRATGSMIERQSTDNRRYL